ncbi:arginine--tRNA ligase [Actinoplanes sp. NPDC049265]|uniref:arginine--tRNA ligase n=1 Tax=Actinoplanes sp. NPDC049265 TaxID=3363902 RepID=UPI003711D38C
MNLEALLADRLAAAFAAVAGHPLDPAVRRSPHADFATGAALQLARDLGRDPRAVAAAVREKADLTGIATAEISGPGFINLTVDDRLLTDAKPAIGTAEPRTVVIDYSAPNVAKELQVHHLRSTVIGDAVARLLTRLGHDVRRANHLGDWGTPFGLLVEHLLDGGELSMDDLTGFYQAARARFDNDDDFKRRARLRVVALQNGDERTLATWRQLVDVSEKHFMEVYARLGVTLTEGDFAGESSYNDDLPRIVEELDAKGLLRVSDGALCAFPEGFTGRDGEPVPLIVRKSDGGFGYAATDLAAVRHRVGVLGADRLLYVVGAPQRTHFQMVWAVARAAGWLPDHVEVEHVAFGSILGTDGKMLKSRSGGTLRLSALLDEAHRRAAELTGGDENADAVGIGAIKYADLSTDRRSDYVFDWDRMLALTGNSGPYLQMAYARIRSILAKAGDSEPGPVTIGHPRERALALELAAFEPAVATVAGTLEFHRLTAYLYGLASAFSSFSEACPVLRAEPGVRASRLALCERTAETLRQGLDLLGIRTPERL